jgi:NTE family protein
MKRLRLMMTMLGLGIAVSVHAQTYQNLVFEGGGVRGLAFTGALQVLDSFRVLDGIRNIAGTSSGALQAALLASGNSVSGVRKLIGELNIQKFNDGHFSILGGGIRLRKNYGYYRGHSLNSWIGGVLESSTGKADLTFHQLDSLTKTDRKFRHLYVVVTDLTHQRPWVLSHLNVPDMLIRDAVTASCSIPFYFEPLAVTATGARLPDGTTDSNAIYLTDGGLSANFPYWVFDSIGGATLGLTLDRPEVVRQFEYNGTRNTPFRILNVQDFIESCYQMVIEQQKLMLPAEALRDHTVAISIGDIKPRIRRMKDHEIAQLLHNGRSGVLHFMERKSTEALKDAYNTDK